VAWSIAHHLHTTEQNTTLSSTHTPAPAVVHTTLHALCIHFQHHRPHPHTTSRSRNTEAAPVKYTNATPFPEYSKKQPGTPASLKAFKGGVLLLLLELLPGWRSNVGVEIFFKGFQSSTSFCFCFCFLSFFLGGAVGVPKSRRLQALLF
jgi:hypothetical protein